MIPLALLLSHAMTNTTIFTAPEPYQRSEEPTLPSISEWQFCCNRSVSDIGAETESSSHGNGTCDLSTVTAFSSCKHLLDEPVLEVLVWVVGLSSFVGNALVLIFRSRWYFKLESSFARVHALMILSLALADILNGVYLLIIGSADLRFAGQYFVYAEVWLGSPLCVAAGFIATLSSEMSVLMLTLISIDRLLAVIFPFRVERRLGIKSTAVTLALLWSTVVIVCAIPLILPGTFSGFYGNSDVCVGLPVGLYIYALPGGGELEIEGPSWFFGTALYVWVNLVCVIVIFVSYVTIFVVVRRSARRLHRTKDQSQEIQLAGRMAVIVCTDFVAWFPIVVMFLFVLAQGWSMPQTLYAFIVVFLLPLNSAINPYIYTATQLISKMRNRRKKRGTATRSTDQHDCDAYIPRNGNSLEMLT